MHSYSVKKNIFVHFARTAMFFILLMSLAAASCLYAREFKKHTIVDGLVYRMNVGDTIQFLNPSKPHYSAMANNLYAYTWGYGKGAKELADFKRDEMFLLVTAKKAGTFTISAGLDYTVPNIWKSYSEEANFTVEISD